MEYEKIKKIMEDMSNSKLSSLNIDFSDGTKISMTKDNTNKCEEQLNSNANGLKDNYNVNSASSRKENMGISMSNTDNNHEQKILKDKQNYKIIKSPMVGTFYSKPSPDSKSFVEVGSKIKKGDVICIIEAMKLMNEIESDYSGIVKEILVKDGEAVDYGKELFIIDDDERTSND